MLVCLCNVCTGLGHGTEAREITNDAKTDSVQCTVDADCKVVCPECDCKCKAHVCDCT